MSNQPATAVAKPRMSASERLLQYGDRTGPGSAIRVIAGDGATFYAALPALIHLVLSEVGSKGVDDHDRVANLAERDTVPFEGFIGRFVDTLDLVGGILFADGEQRALIAHTIKEVHRHVEGTLDDGTRYHAWNKDVWAWSWAGIMKPVVDAYQILHGPQSQQFLDDAYIGTLQLGDLIGVRGLPDSYPEFLEYWEQQWIPMALGTGTGKFLASLAQDVPLPAAAPWIPKPAWTTLTAPLRNMLLSSSFLVMEPRIQQLLEIEPTTVDRVSVGVHHLIWRAAPRALTSELFSTYMGLRLRYGNTSWKRHYSPAALADYRKQVEHARAQGLPQPKRH
jgi:uncharacterized protein (DUF2236 family)